MTKKIILTKGTFEGQIVLLYNKEGWLIGYRIEGELKPEQQRYFANKIPIHTDNLGHFVALLGFNAVEEVEELTFDKFYEEYNYKEGRIKAQTAWNRLSKNDQMAAYLYINRYNDSLTKKGGIGKQYPATYLNQKRWKD